MLVLHATHHKSSQLHQTVAGCVVVADAARVLQPLKTCKQLQARKRYAATQALSGELLGHSKPAEHWVTSSDNHKIKVRVMKGGAGDGRVVPAC